MLTNLWRYSHFALAVSSALFILLATLTGIVLAFEPIENQLRPCGSPCFVQLSLATVIDSLEGRYEEILDIEVNADQCVKAAVVSWEDESLNGDFYIDPTTGAKLADIPSKRPLFEFVTNLHRSLFLKTPGRIFVGMTSFFLFLIAVTGFLLFLQRQRSVRKLLSKIVKEDFAQYYHVVTGRLMLIPVIIIAATGVYLSLLRFSLLPEPEPQVISSREKGSSNPEMGDADFAIFRTTKLKAVRRLEFPFSDDEEDFFVLQLHDRELKINQKSGKVVEELKYPFVNYLSELSFNLHTGVGSIGWSVVLALAGFNILFFIYSGAIISLRRLRSGIRNQFPASEAEIIILVGSENGSTRKFGKILLQALIKLKKKVYLDELNAYDSYPNMTELVVLTSTYGVGDPPANAGKFLALFDQKPLIAPIHYTVVGFGSLAYPDFCKFALEVDDKLRRNENCTARQDQAFLIHNKSYTSFQTWADKWAGGLGLQLNLPAQIKAKKGLLFLMRVIDHRVVNDGFSETFLLQLNTGKQNKFQSGDLLAVYPPDDPLERLYSIARVSGNDILLSIKRHEKGICSNFLYRLEPGSTIRAGIQRNPGFHLPARSSSVIMIANGTGLAPFLGMIAEGAAGTPYDLYWGGRNSSSYDLYRDRIEKFLANGKLRSAETAFSRETASDHKYVQDLIKKNSAKIAGQLQDGGAIMICGSVAMQNGVLDVLEQLCREHLENRLSYFQQRKQILMDCY